MKTHALKHSATPSSGSLDTYYRLFKGRTDKLGRSDVMSVDVESEHEVLDFVQQHRDGKLRIGFYNLLPNGTCPWAMVEFENHGNLSVENPPVTSVLFMNHLKSAGLSCYREMSKDPGGECFHVWIYFDKPMSAKKVHLALKSLLHNAMGIDVEVFPKSYDTSKIGNFVWLPLFGGSDARGLGGPKGRTVFVDDANRSYPDQDGFLSSIVPATESQFDDLIAKYKLKIDAPGYNLREAMLVDGLEKLRKCPFMKFCEDNAATLPEPLWYASITNAVRVKGGRQYIHEWSAKYPKYSRMETERKIAHALADTGPMSYAAIVKAGWQGTPPLNALCPVTLAYRIDVSAEVTRIKGIGDPTERKSEIEKFIKACQRIQPLDRDEARTLLKKDLGVSTDAFDSMIKKFDPASLTESETLRQALEAMSRAKPERRAEVVFQWMGKEGVQFFKDRQNTAYALFNKTMEPISTDNASFRSFFYDKTGTSLASGDGRVYVDVLANLARKSGKLIEPSSWIYSDVPNYTVYFNLNVPERQLVEIGPDNIRVVDQADNDKSVVLKDSEKIKPIKYAALTDQEYTAALKKEKYLIVDNIPCAEASKIFCNAWRIGGMFVDFVHMRPVMRFEGKTSSGKTWVSDMFSYLLYGESQKKKATEASNYSDAAQNPLLILDNLEVKNMNQGLTDFLLGASVGTSKEKRRSGTDTAIILEKARCLLLSNGIENFSENEILNRTYIVEFDIARFGSSVTSDLFGEIAGNRDLLLSAEFMLVSKVLKRIKNGDRKAVLAQLQQNHKGHSKQRSDEYFAIMIMIVEELLKAWGSNQKVWDLVAAWVKEQNDVSQQTHSGANVVLTALDILRRKAERHQAKALPPDQWTFDVQMQTSLGSPSIILEGFAADFHAAFKGVAGVAGYDLSRPTQLGKRIKDAEEILKTAGYKVVITHPGDRNYYVIEFSSSSSTTGTGSTATSVPGPVPESKTDDSAIELPETEEYPEVEEENEEK
jgi:hypothetical protein